MKALLAALLIVAPIFAQAYTWTDSDTSTPVFVDDSNPYQYTFDLTQGANAFQPGIDLISSYKLSVHLYDDSHDSVLDFNVASLDQPGVSGDDLSIFWSSGDLGGSSYQGKATLNSTGKLEVSIFALAGSFFVDTAYLVADGTKNSSASVPEPTSVALLAAGLLGIVVMRRSSNRA